MTAPNTLLGEWVGGPGNLAVDFQPGREIPPPPPRWRQGALHPLPTQYTSPTPPVSILYTRICAELDDAVRCLVGR